MKLALVLTCLAMGVLMPTAAMADRHHRRCCPPPLVVIERDCPDSRVIIIYPAEGRPRYRRYRQVEVHQKTVHNRTDEVWQSQRDEDEVRQFHKDHRHSDDND